MKNSQQAIEKPYPFPDLITLDFKNYPELKKIIFERADESLLSTEHIAISLISAGIIARMEKANK